MNLQTRFNFIYNYLAGASTMINLAKKIEEKGQNVSDNEKEQHRAFVAGSIMQSVAALESDIWNIINHGIGQHLGSNGVDLNTKELLKSFSEVIEKGNVVSKLKIILQLSRGVKLDMGTQPMQDLELVIKLRNELVHFKSINTLELDELKYLKQLQQKDSTPPPYKPDGYQNFFPLICLTAKRAEWVLNTIILFVEYYYKQLGVVSPIHNRKIDGSFSD